MKNLIILVLLCLLLVGCGAKTAPVETSAPIEEANTQIPNPWKDYPSLAEAEAACSLTFPMPELIADNYAAESFRVMNEQLLEVTYRDGDFSVIVRMQAGEDQDLSGVYGEFENVQTSVFDGAAITSKDIDGGIVQLISKDGYSYSLYAPKHYVGDSNVEFLQYLYDAK